MCTQNPTQDERAQPWHTLKAPTRGMLALVVLGALAVASIYAQQLPYTSLDSVTLMCVILALMTGPIAIRIPMLRASLSMDTLFVFALVLLGTDEVAVLVSGLAMVLGELRSGEQGRPWYVLPFNGATGVLAAGAAAGALAWMGGVQELGLGLSVMVMAPAYMVVNVFLVAVAIAQTRGRSTPLVPVLFAMSFTGPAFVGAACVAGLMVWMMAIWPVLGLLVVPLAVLLYATILSHCERLKADQQHAQEIERLYLPTVAAIASAIEARDAADGGHHARVQELSLALAEEMGVTDAVTLRAIRFGALLHDLGRIALSDAVLLKEGELTASERRQIEMHPVLGAELIRHIPFEAPVADAIRYHHERWDGQGYPEGLSHEAIPLPARLIAVAEVYDTVTRSRLARQSMTSAEALAEIHRESGHQFDPQVAQALEGALRRLEGRPQTVQPSPALKAIASGAMCQGLELRLAKALEPAVSLQEVLEHTACESAGVLPVEAWALCVTPPGALRKAVATLGEVSVEAAGSLDLADQEQAAVDMGSWWSLVARTDGRPSLTMPLPVRASGHWELVVHLSGEPGCELLTSALSQALIHPLTAAINRICDAEAGKRLALTDPLTGVGNRLGMERALEQLTGSEVPLGVLLLDLNNFKGINDHFGHDLGDEALRRVGQVLRELTRDGLAEVFRLGGDEFVILAPVEARVLELLSTRFRRGIEAIELEVAPGELLPMSTSIGRAWTASLGGNSAELFKAADQDMFTDKRNNPRRQPRGARPRTRRSSCLGAVSRRSVPRLSKLTPMLVVGSGSCGG